MRRPLVALALGAALALPACLDNAPQSATFVLFDVSVSIQDAAIRDRYLSNFDLLLQQTASSGGALAADVIDDNPLAHASLAVNVEFEPCGLLDNALTCEREREALREQAARVAEAPTCDPPPSAPTSSVRSGWRRTTSIRTGSAP